MCSSDLVRPAGHEEVPADFLAVQMEIGHAQGGPVQGRAADRPRQEECFPEKRGGLAALGFSFSISDPMST